MRFGELSDNFYRYCRRWKRNSDEFVSSVLNEIDQSSKTHANVSDDDKDSILNSQEDETTVSSTANHVISPITTLPLHMNFRYFSFLMFRSPHVVIHTFVGSYKPL